MQKILLVGGAGYIGSHMNLQLNKTGFEVIVLDNLSTGHADAVLSGELVEGDLADTVLLDELFTKHQFAAVMHFASSILVGESVQKPDLYYQNNVVNTLNLLNAMIKHRVLKFVFSSTAAIFGEPKNIPMKADAPKLPINPYGKSKWIIEQVLQDYDVAYGMKSICLRYFNAAGADPAGRLGERHDPETHLIPLVLQVPMGMRDHISIFGDDYKTSDGTCVRDYIHVNDLCTAHLLALDKLLNNSDSAQYNLGNGTGFSVKEVIEVAQEVVGQNIKTIIAPKREGDPAVLIADSSEAKESLGWCPKYDDLKVIIEHTWKYYKKTRIVMA